MRELKTQYLQNLMYEIVGTYIIEPFFINEIIKKIAMLWNDIIPVICNIFGQNFHSFIGCKLLLNTLISFETLENVSSFYDRLL